MLIINGLLNKYEGIEKSLPICNCIYSFISLAVSVHFDS